MLKCTSERETLLAQVRALPGKANYTQDKLSLWFSTHRTKTGVGSRRRGRPRIQRGLTEQVEDDLTVFIRETPNPSDELLGVWARALGCEVGEMKVFIERKRAQRMLTPEVDDEYSEDEEEEEVTEISQQPTTLVFKPWIPLQSSSTESQPESSASRFRMWTPPARQPTPPCSSTADLEFSPMSVSAFASTQASDAAPPDEVDADANAITLTSSSETSPFHEPSTPMSSSEFLARFAPYEAKMRSIIADCQLLTVHCPEAAADG
ncbi:hypothetical protein BDZ89DRAFT_408444 [Hymenopellis radicata]|nr:hypothetical protein BDZ89DRAFT_408444 [Hymenopellis radicata]